MRARARCHGGLLIVAGLSMQGAASASEGSAPSLVAGDHRAPVTGIEAKLWTILSAPATDGDASNAEAIRRVGALGPDAAPVVVGILTGQVEAPDAARAGAADPTAARRRRAILEASLRKLPRARVLTEIQALAPPTAELDARLVAIELLGAVAGVDALDAIVEISGHIDAIHFQRPYVQSSIEGAVARIFGESPSAQGLRRTVSGVSRELLPLCLRGAARSGSPASVALLAAFFGRDKALDLVIVQELGGLAESSYALLPDTELARVRGFLNHPDPELVRAAAKVLGTSGDADSCSTLIALLGHSDKRVAASAHWSLKRLSGLQTGANRTEWSRWHEAQLEWRDTQFNALIAELSSDDAGSVVHALGKIVVHPLFKHEAAEALRPGLESANPSVARMTASMLGQLGSVHAVPWLVELLESPDAQMKRSAAESLRQLTGKTASNDRESWATALRL